MYRPGLNDLVLLAILRPDLVERLRDAHQLVADDHARRIVAGGNFLIISPSRSHVAAAKAAQEGKPDAVTAHARNRRLMELHGPGMRDYAQRFGHMVKPGFEAEHRAATAEFGYNERANVRLSGMLEHHLRLPHVRAVGGYREAGTAHTPGAIPTEGSFVVQHHGGFLHEAVKLGHHFGQDSIIYGEAGKSPRLIGLTYDQNHRGTGHKDWGEFEPDRVKVIKPSTAHVAALSGHDTIAFTHAWEPGSRAGDHHHDPIHKLTQAAFALVPKGQRGRHDLRHHEA